MNFILHPQARKEFFEAVEFYAAESISAAERFITEFEEAARKIGEYPTRYRRVRKASRVKEFGRFPYSLIYRVLDDGIEIDAVAHDKRRPGYWRNRL